MGEALPIQPHAKALRAIPHSLLYSQREENPKFTKRRRGKPQQCRGGVGVGGRRRRTGWCTGPSTTSDGRATLRPMSAAPSGNSSRFPSFALFRLFVAPESQCYLLGSVTSSTILEIGIWLGASMLLLPSFSITAVSSTDWGVGRSTLVREILPCGSKVMIWWFALIRSIGRMLRCSWRKMTTGSCRTRYLRSRSRKSSSRRSLKWAPSQCHFLCLSHTCGSCSWLVFIIHPSIWFASFSKRNTINLHVPDLTFWVDFISTFNVFQVTTCTQFPNALEIRNSFSRFKENRREAFHFITKLQVCSLLVNHCSSLMQLLFYPYNSFINFFP